MNRKCIFCIAGIVMFVGACATGRGEAPSSVVAPTVPNGGFEDAAEASSNQPAIWVQDGTTHHFQLDDQNPKEGRYALSVSYTDGLGPEGYAGAMQTLDVRAWAQTTVVLEAQIKKSERRSKAGLWMLVANEAKEKLLYVNSYEHPGVDRLDWTLHRLEVKLPADAAVMRFGVAIYEHDGMMWADAVTLQPR